jgi:hypothetical protein
MEFAGEAPLYRALNGGYGGIRCGGRDFPRGDPAGERNVPDPGKFFSGVRKKIRSDEDQFNTGAPVAGINGPESNLGADAVYVAAGYADTDLLHGGAQ